MSQEFEKWWSSTPILGENKRTIAMAAWLAAQSEFEAMEEDLDTVTHHNIDLQLKNSELTGLLHMAKELLSTISLHNTMAPADWCESFKREVADRIKKLKAATQPPEDAK